MNAADIQHITQNWINRFVIELNLCPFAKAEIQKNAVRFKVSSAESEHTLLNDLSNELDYLDQHPNIETTLLIHPKVLTSFNTYNDFLNICDALLIDKKREGIYQIASFHPDYQFAHTDKNDAENYSNKSPYPMLHLLRESSLEHTLQKYPNPQQIPDNNIKKLKQQGTEHCKQRLKDCFKSIK